MNSELLINSTGEGVRIALLEDKELVECHIEDDASQYNVGDLYLGTVKKVVPGLNAAFIDIGYEKDAFLHYLDLGPKFRSLVKYTKGLLNKKINNYKLTDFKLESEIDKLGKINQILTKNQKILVQVSKEPISSKGPRLSCEVSIAGRFIVLVPFSNTVSVSRKINDSKERTRLKRLITSIKPDNFGVIIRTVAQNKEVAELDRDLKECVQKFQDMSKAVRTASPRDRVLTEIDRTSSLLRDVMNESFDSVTIDDSKLYETIRDYVKGIAPEKEKIVKHHSGKAKLFESRGIEKQLKTLFGRSVSLKGGGYLIIDHTEALHVVDVNSGNKSSTESSQENTALNTNLQSAKEVARQLRLRDMGGIIVIDFIDMKSAENRKKVYEAMREELKGDKAKSVVLPLSKFGLMQITRQRVRPELNITTSEECPSCKGTGKITASIQIADLIKENIKYLLTKQNEKGITLTVHPYLESYFTKGFPSRRMQWFFDYKTWVRIEKDSSMGVVDFKIFDKNREKIETM